MTKSSRNGNFSRCFIQNLENLAPYIIIKLNKKIPIKHFNMKNLKSTIYCGTVSQNGDILFSQNGNFLLEIGKNIIFAMGTWPKIGLQNVPKP